MSYNSWGPKESDTTQFGCARTPVNIHTHTHTHTFRFMCLVAKSCLTLCDTMDCSPPGSSVYGISQARILEWVSISFFKPIAPGIPRWSPIQVLIRPDPS